VDGDELRYLIGKNIEEELIKAIEIGGNPELLVTNDTTALALSSKMAGEMELDKISLSGLMVFLETQKSDNSRLLNL